MNESFGQMLCRLRSERGMSKYELATKSHVSHSNIFKIERGQRGVPPPMTVEALAFGMDLTDAERDAFYEVAISEKMGAVIEPYELRKALRLRRVMEG